MVNNVPMQGDIIKINLDPKMGHEQMGYRPADNQGVTAAAGRGASSRGRHVFVGTSR
jgi:hypothetical protein